MKNKYLILAGGGALLIFGLYFASLPKGDRDPPSKSSHSPKSKVTAIPRGVSRKAVSSNLRGLSLGHTPKIDKSKSDMVKTQLIASGDVAGLASLALLSGDPEVLKELRAHPEEPLACQALALASATLEERHEWASKLAEITPDDPSARLILANSLYELGSTDEAKELLKDLTLDSDDPFNLSAGATRQQAIWELCGNDSEEAAVLARETGYPRIFISSITQALVAMEGDNEAGLQIIRAMERSKVTGASLSAQLRLLTAEGAIRGGISPSNVASSETGARLRALRLVDSRTTSVLLDDTSNLGADYYKQLNENGLRFATNWLLGDIPEVAEAFK